MASDLSTHANGTYAQQHQSYAAHDQNNYSNYNGSTQSSAPAAQAAAPTNGNATQPQEVSKDEVGWYFVEQYYTTLSRTPDRLHLFYQKRSQFVSGQETDKVEVCVGQRAINDKIQALDFQDCKVRVTNVDSQASDSNIVIQVIGEISNKSQPHKKFVQTFVLATQTNGYFVLNDIFRYLAEDDEDAEEGAAPVEESATHEEPSTSAPELKTLADPAAIEKVDQSLQETAEQDTPPVAAIPTTNGDSSESAIAPEAKTEVTESAVLAQTPPAEPELKPEAPKEPEPTRTPTPAIASQPAAAPKPVAPAVPKTWATLAAAANKVATPVNASAASSGSTKQAKPQAAPAAPSAPSAPTATPAPADAPAASAAAPSGPAKDVHDDEWTAVGSSHNRQTSRQGNAPTVDSQALRGYIKGVFEHVTYDELKAALEKFGELSHFDIARAPKNCAFVDFKTAEGFSKAIKSPFEVHGDTLIVEERRPSRAGPAYPRGPFPGRGGRGGAGGQGAPRGGNNFTPNNRGNFGPRGRGGAAAPRGARAQA